MNDDDPVKVEIPRRFVDLIDALAVEYTDGDRSVMVRKAIDAYFATVQQHAPDVMARAQKRVADRTRQ